MPLRRRSTCQWSWHDSVGRSPRDRVEDIGQLHLHTNAPLLTDSYKRNRSTGGFILVDEFTHATVAAGMIL